MNKLVELKLIPWLSFILGVAICTSTSILSISYTAIAILIFFRSNFIDNFKMAVKNWYVLGGVLFYLVFVCAVFWSHAPSHDTWKMLVRIIGYLLLPLFFMAFSTNNSAQLLLRGFFIGAMLSAVLSILSFLFKHHMLYGIQDNTWVVFHGHILHNAFLSIAASFCLWNVFDSSKSKSRRLWFLAAYLILFTDNLFIVNGRTGQLMLLAMSAFVFIYRFKFKGLIFLAVLSCLTGPLLYISPMVQKGIKDYNSDTRKYESGDPMSSVGLRYEFHTKSKELIKQSPFIGHGTGSFKSAYQNYTNFSGLRATSNPHCDWLWIGVEAGSLGIVVYLIFLILTIFSLNQLSSPCYKCGGYTLLLGYLLSGLQNSFFIDNVTGMAFIVIMASILAAGKQINNQPLL